MRGETNCFYYLLIKGWTIDVQNYKRFNESIQETVVAIILVQEKSNKTKKKPQSSHVFCVMHWLNIHVLQSSQPRRYLLHCSAGEEIRNELLSVKRGRKRRG